MNGWLKSMTVVMALALMVGACGDMFANHAGGVFLMAKPKLIINDKKVSFSPGQTILEAADAAGIYIPRLCALKDLSPYGSCRVCTVLCNGRPQAACTQPVAEGMVVENETDKVKEIRKGIIEMLFVEGNHFCMFCEKSGNCELQALAYRFQMLVPGYPYLFPKKQLDGQHQDFYIDRNRCILCGRCVRASEELDGKSVFWQAAQFSSNSLFP